MSWRFACSPKWIVRHVAVVLLVSAMIVALFWQLGRLHEKRSYKALVQHRQEEPARPLEELLPPGVELGDRRVGDELYRTATAAGTYVADRTITVENRTDVHGNPGAWVLTPLDLGDGRAVLVNRGFLGYDVNGKIVPPPPPTGRVEVTGLLFPTQNRGFFGARDPKTGVLSVVARVDLQRIGAQVPEHLLPAYVQLAASLPTQPSGAKDASDLVPLGAPVLSEGPHLSYAVQWAIFSTIAVVGYGVLLRKVAIQQAKDHVGVTDVAPTIVDDET